MPLLKPRGSSSSSSSGSSSSSRREYVNSQGMRVRTSDPEPTTTSSSSSGSSSPSSSGGGGYQFDNTGGLSDEQVAELNRIANQDFVDQDAIGSGGGLSSEELRDIANQDFVSNDVSDEINQALDQEEGVSLSDLSDRNNEPDVPQVEPVDTESTITAEEAASTTGISDTESRLTEFIDRMRSLQDRLLEATMPTEDELAMQERIRENRESFEEAQAQSRQRLAPNFAIRGELSQRQDVHSRRQNRLRGDLQAAVKQRSNRVSQLRQVMQNNQQNFQMMQTLQKMTRPDVLSTKVNQETGEVYSIVQDPMTGEITTQRAGNVGAQDKELNWREVILEDGSKAIYARNDEGEIVVQKIPGSIGGVSQLGNGSGGNDTVDPQQSVANLADAYLNNADALSEENKTALDQAWQNAGLGESIDSYPDGASLTSRARELFEAEIRNLVDIEQQAQDSLGEDELTASPRNKLQSAGLMNSSRHVQGFYLAADNDFHEFYTRGVLKGDYPGQGTREEINNAYDQWLESQDKDTESISEYRSLYGEDS